MHSLWCGNAHPLSLSCSCFWGRRRTRHLANWKEEERAAHLPPYLVPARTGEICFCSQLNYSSPTYSIKPRNFSTYPEFLRSLCVELAKFQGFWAWYCCFEQMNKFKELGTHREGYLVGWVNFWFSDRTGTLHVWKQPNPWGNSSTVVELLSQKLISPLKNDLLFPAYR